MTMIKRIRFRWNQPHNEGKRLVVGLILNLAAMAACLWVLWQAVAIIAS
jgi:hypothetical protein